MVIAAITSCTNTSNPSVMLAAGLVAKKAADRGLKARPWVKTSLAPGSKVVTEYLTETGLLPYLEEVGFYVVGYGCTTCIGNSGPLAEPVVEAIREGDIVAASVLSGNRNFEGRINPHIRANYLASPPLVVAYALAGTVDIDLTSEPLGQDPSGQRRLPQGPLAELCRHHRAARGGHEPRNLPAPLPRDRAVQRSVERDSGQGRRTVRLECRQHLRPGTSLLCRHEPRTGPIEPIRAARVLVKVGDSVTTDHISPAGSIAAESPAGRYLIDHGVDWRDFNTYGSRRGNDQVMTRGTFANIRLKNQLAPGTEGGWTTDFTSGEVTSIFEASRNYRNEGIPTIVLAGIDYGMGSSRDWAAKGVFLLGVRAAIAKSYERIHRSNLVGMGVLPLQFRDGEDARSLGLDGRETFTIHVDDAIEPGQQVTVDVTREDGSSFSFGTVCRLDSPVEIDYYRNGGILHTVLRNILRSGVGTQPSAAPQ